MTNVLAIPELRTWQGGTCGQSSGQFRGERVMRVH